MDMMKMTAMESLLDKNMVYLDISAGIAGVILYKLILDGVNNFELEPKMDLLKKSAVVLISRIIIDYSYHSLVSKTGIFGGTDLEFVSSSIMWFFIMHFMNGGSDKNTVMLFSSTTIMMFAIARLTHWG